MESLDDLDTLSGARPTVLVLHGAATTPTSLADLQGIWQRAWQEHELHESADLRFSDWRQRAAIKLGPGENTVPTRPPSPLDGPANAFRLATGQVAQAVTDLGERRRWQVMHALGPQLLGDVMAYTRYRSKIHRIIKEDLRAIPPNVPIVAVGHSLGGIALVDLLAEHKDPRVRILVTVGSQAPILYTFDALASLPLGTTKTRPFTPWLNVFDRHDFLAFLASSIFPATFFGVGPILDIEVASGRPFPEAHGAYWSQRTFWRVMSVATKFAAGHYRSLASTPSQVIAARDWGPFHMAVTLGGFGELAEDMGRWLERHEEDARRTREAHVRSMAEHALTSIERGWEDERRLESGARYWDVISDKVAMVEGELTADRAARILVDYQALKPPDWEDSAFVDPWLLVIVDTPGDATMEATELLRASGVRVFSKQELDPLKHKYGIDVD